jgi:hypothetical protein
VTSRASKDIDYHGDHLEHPEPNQMRAAKLKGLFDKGLAISILTWLFLSLFFSLAYTQSHLFNDNQNTKFLHGLAQGGRGLLAEDWLANTADPLPVFSLLVRLTDEFLDERLFYVYFALLMGIYAYGILGIASTLYGMNRSLAKFLVYFSLILAFHSIQGQIFVRKALGFDMEILQFGLAGQYLLGLDFQNSSFGVFLLLSIHAFLRRNNLWAILWLALASIFHSAYLFSAGLLTVAYLGILFVENLRLSKAETLVEDRSVPTQRIAKEAREPFMLGLLALVLVFPVVWYNQTILSSTSPELSGQALEILVHQRIPHHSLPQLWLNAGAYIQIGIMLAGLFLVRRTRLFPVMLIPFLGGAAGTLIQIITGSDSLALLAPWRVSVFLVPLSTCLLIAWPVAKLIDRYLQDLRIVVPVIVVLSMVAIVYLSRSGWQIQSSRFARYRGLDVHPVMDFVKESKAPGDVYLIPPRDNQFDEFRTYTGAPAFINWKSHPYRDFEVLEWYDRNLLAQDFYERGLPTACGVLQELMDKYHVTHVVIGLAQPMTPCDGMQEKYRDRYFAVYSLQGT